MLFVSGIILLPFPDISSYFLRSEIELFYCLVFFLLLVELFFFSIQIMNTLHANSTKTNGQND